MPGRDPRRGQGPDESGAWAWNPPGAAAEARRRRAASRRAGRDERRSGGEEDGRGAAAEPPGEDRSSRCGQPDGAGPRPQGRSAPRLRRERTKPANEDVAAPREEGRRERDAERRGKREDDGEGVFG